MSSTPALNTDLMALEPGEGLQVLPTCCFSESAHPCVYVPGMYSPVHRCARL